MSGSDLNSVEWKMAEALAKERREARAYAILAVMLTPAFIAVWWCIVMAIGTYFFLRTVPSGPRAFYAAVNFFLATVVSSVFVSMQGQINRKWLVGVTLFLVLLAMTYTTPMLRLLPALHGFAYAILGFVIVGLMGQVHLDAEFAKSLNDDSHLNEHGLLLAVCGFIVNIYGQLVRTLCWWRPLGPDEIRHGAAVLVHLGNGIELSSLSHTVLPRVLTTLETLELVQETDG